MLHVLTKIAPSEIHGLGVFAADAIKSGRVVWQYNMFLDTSFEESELPKLPECQQINLRKHCYINPEQPGVLVICADDARFINFSEKANLIFGDKTLGEDDLIAARDIEAGEELTVFPETDLDFCRKMEANGHVR